MNNEQFVEGICKSIYENFVKNFLKFYEKVPGRKPHKKDLIIAEYLKTLKTEDLENLKLIMEECVASTLFKVFCILDHVRFIEGEGEKSTFELYAIKGNEKVLINDPKQEELHAIFTNLIHPEENE